MTPQIHLHVLASGSKGNAAVVEGPEGSVLVDCGISRRALLQRAAELGVDMDCVRAVVLTHDHSDHVAGLSVFCNHFEGRLIATAGTVGARKYLTELPFELVGHSDAFEVAGMRVQAFPTYHDVPDPMGFRFETDDDALGYCTDTGHLGKEALEALRPSLQRAGGPGTDAAGGRGHRDRGRHAPLAGEQPSEYLRAHAGRGRGGRRRK